MDYQEYYSLIEKPFFAPPEWVFGAVWTIIYPLIAISFFTALFLWFQKKLDDKTISVFVLNIILNLAFTPLLLRLDNSIFATIDILVLLGTLLYLMKKFWISSRLIFWLLIPYLLWGAFATILQVSIFFLN